MPKYALLISLKTYRDINIPFVGISDFYHNINMTPYFTYMNCLDDCYFSMTDTVIDTLPNWDCSF